MSIEKPILKLYNTDFTLVALIDDYQQAQIEHNLYSAGAFSISINYNIPNARLFERGLFIQFGDNARDFCVIQSVENSIGSSGKGSEYITVSGYDCRYLFKRRIIKNLNSNDTWSMTAKGELCIRSLVADQCGVNAEEKRKLPITNIIPDENSAIGSTYSVSEAYSNLYDTLVTIATQSEIGWAVEFNGSSLNLVVYQGENKSNNVFFSTDFESLANGKYKDSNDSYSNSVYIGGKGTGSERDIYEGEVDEPEGLERFESYDNQSSMTTEEEYEEKARSILSQYGQTITVSGAGLAKCPYVFREQYDIGDVIKLSFSGKSANTQILSVSESWVKGSYSLSFNFGKPVNTLSDQLNIMLRKIQDASNKSSATTSVKWYDAANNIEQDSGDVTFDTLGFTGTLTANSTFKLYLDDEKTGAKSYNVYCKNLSGNYNLTLTTGVSGATNFTIKGGVNIVARILVDENGNVISQGMTATDVIEAGNNQPISSDGLANSNLNPVDTVESGNLHSVTSNAVVGALQGKLNNTLSNITSSDIDNLSDTEISVSRIRNYDISWPSDDGFIIHIPWSDAYARQIAMDDQSNWLAVRFKANGQWFPWKVLSEAKEDDSSLVDISSRVSKSLGVKFVSACRRNNLVYMYISGTYTGSPTVSTQPFVNGLPDKYLPKFGQNFSVVSYMTSGNLVYPSRIIVEGNSISIGETSMPSGSQIRMGFIYIGA